jgi:AAA domain
MGHRGTLDTWAKLLGGEVSRIPGGDWVIHCPGDGHSAKDRSLAVWIDDDAPDGFSVYSFAGDDVLMSRDYVRMRCHLPRFEPKAKANGHGKPNGKANGHAKANGHGKPLGKLVETYDYRDMEGADVLRVSRYAPKTFRQSHPDGQGGWKRGGIDDAKRLPFRLQEFTERAAQGATVYVVEGEKAAVRLWDAGLAATCSSGGAGHWPDHHARWFAGFTVIILADNDAPGHAHADRVMATLLPVAAAVRIIHLPGLAPGADVFDWIEAGNDPQRIADLPSGSPQRGYLATTLWDMQFPPVKFIIPGYITEGLTLLAGAPKRGKSWLALDLCCSVAMGGYTLGDQHCEQGDVLYCALEDSPRRMHERLHKVLQLSQRAPQAMSVWFGPDLPRLGNGCEEALEEWIEAHARARLIAIDTLNYIRPERTRDEDPYTYDYRSASPLQQLALKHRIGIVLIHHTRKSPTDDYLESVSGTNGLTGGSDTVVVLDRASDGTSVLKGRGRDLEEFETAVRFDRDECKWRVLGDAAETRVSDTRKAIMTVLQDAGWLMSVHDIARQVNRPRNVVDQQLFKMLKDGQVTRQGRGMYGLPTVVIEGGKDDDE